MYICKKHGKVESDWCDKCNKLIERNHSETKTTRFKDLIYDCDEGERCVTVFLTHCKTCDESISIGFKRGVTNEGRYFN